MATLDRKMSKIGTLKWGTIKIIRHIRENREFLIKDEDIFDFSYNTALAFLAKIYTGGGGCFVRGPPDNTGATIRVLKNRLKQLKKYV